MTEEARMIGPVVEEDAKVFRLGAGSSALHPSSTELHGRAALSLEESSTESHLLDLLPDVAARRVLELAHHLAISAGIQEFVEFKRKVQNFRAAFEKLSATASSEEELEIELDYAEFLSRSKAHVRRGVSWKSGERIRFSALYTDKEDF